MPLPLITVTGTVRKPKLAELVKRAGAVLDVPVLVGDVVVRKKLFRSGAGRSTYARVDLDVGFQHGFSSFHSAGMDMVGAMIRQRGIGVNGPSVGARGAAYQGVPKRSLWAMVDISLRRTPRRLKPSWR